MSQERSLETIRSMRRLKAAREALIGPIRFPEIEDAKLQSHIQFYIRHAYEFIERAERDVISALQSHSVKSTREVQ